MARVCSVCEKRPMSGNKVSHSNIKTKKKWGVNVHKLKNEEGIFTGKYICTRCMRTLKK